MSEDPKDKVNGESQEEGSSAEKNKEVDLNEVAAIPVSEVMNTDVISAGERTKIQVALKMILNKRIAGLPIVNDQDHLIGVVSEKDILLSVASGNINDNIQFTREPDFIMSHEPIKKVILKLLKNNRKWLPVTDNAKRVVGIIARRDVLNVFNHFLSRGPQ